MSEAAASHDRASHASARHAGHDHGHKVPLMGLFMALSALTAAEVGLFELWSRVDTVHALIPKYALVLLILVFTFPKALIVLIFFMHLKFEKHFIVFLAIVPFPFVAIAILPTLIDAQTLNSWGMTTNKAVGLKEVGMHHPGDGTHGAAQLHEDGAPAAIENRHLGDAEPASTDHPY